MQVPTEITVNNQNCFEPVSYIGKTVYRNICFGGSVDVYWGSIEWMAFLFCAGLIAALVGSIIWLVIESSY